MAVAGGQPSVILLNGPTCPRRDGHKAHFQQPEPPDFSGMPL